MYNQNRCRGKQQLKRPFTHAIALYKSQGVLLRKVSTDSSCKRPFCFYGDRMTRVTLQVLHGMTSQKTPHSSTPESKRRTALITRLLKQLVQRWKQGQMYKRSNPSCALGAFCVFNAIKSLEREGRVSSIHPWGNYGQKESK